MHNTVFSAATRKVAILVANGVDRSSYEALRQALEAAGARPVVVAETFCPVTTTDDQEIEVDKSHVTSGSAMVDGVFVPDGAECAETLVSQGDSVQFIQEAFKHCKPIGAVGAGLRLLERAGLDGVALADGDQGVVADKGVITAVGSSTHTEMAARFVEDLAKHRFWERQAKEVPA